MSDELALEIIELLQKIVILDEVMIFALFIIVGGLSAIAFFSHWGGI